MLLTPQEKNAMAEENFNLIHYVAKGFSNTGISHDELVSIGSVGYTKALNTYDAEKGAKFSTYAVNCIKNEILHFLRKERKHMENTVLSGTHLFTDSEGNTLSIEDTISNEMNDESMIEDLILFKEDIKILIEAIEKLSKREQYIIKNRYGLSGGEVMTQSQLADVLEMSQANISKLEQSITKKLFRYLNGRIKLEENGFYLDCLSDNRELTKAMNLEEDNKK